MTIDFKNKNTPQKTDALTSGAELPSANQVDLSQSFSAGEDFRALARQEGLTNHTTPARSQEAEFVAKHLPEIAAVLGPDRVLSQKAADFERFFRENRELFKDHPLNEFLDDV